MVCRLKQLLHGLATRKVTRDLTPFTQQRRKEGGAGRAEDSQMMEEESCVMMKSG